MGATEALADAMCECRDLMFFYCSPFGRAHFALHPRTFGAVDSLRVQLPGL